MNSRILIPLLLVFAVVTVAAPVTAQYPSFDITATAEEADPGDEVTVTFDTTNEGNTTSAAIVNLTEHPDWEITDRTDSDGLWRDDGKWLFQTIESDTTISPAVTFSVPETASGEYTIAAMVTNGESTDNTEVTIQVSDSETETNSDAGEKGGESDSASGPGFGPIVVFGAIIALALVASLRDEHDRK